MWRIGWAPNNASKWQMGFNLTFKRVNLRGPWMIILLTTLKYLKPIVFLFPKKREKSLYLSLLHVSTCHPNWFSTRQWLKQMQRIINLNILSSLNENIICSYKKHCFRTLLIVAVAINWVTENRCVTQLVHRRMKEEKEKGISHWEKYFPLTEIPTVTTVSWRK
jgi:hypothetical protein